MQIIWQDLRFGARILMKKPGFTLIAVITLSLGIGVNTALFASFNLLLRPNSIKDPETVVKIECQSEDINHNFSYPEFIYFRNHTQTLSDLIPTTEEKFLLSEQTPGAEPVELKGVFTSENYLSMLGGSMQLGRFFTEERDAVIVLSHYFWQKRFAGNRDVIGRKLLLNEKPFTIIGVTSPDFVGLQMEMPDIWLPLILRADKSTTHFVSPLFKDRDWFGDQEFQWLNLHGRVQPGKTGAEAQAEFAQMQNQMPRAAGASGPKKFISVAPAFRTGGIESFWITMAVVLGASGLVLLIACSNIANMLLARAAERQKEIGVRLALGAGRWRVIRQLLTESFLLAATGGLFGVIFARWSVALLFPWVIARYDGRDFAKSALSLSLDWHVLAFAMLLIVLSGVGFGLVPALRATRPDLIAVIQEDYVAFGRPGSRSWQRNGLVVGQVALCFVLLIPAGLLLRALMKVFASGRGYEANKLLVVDYRRELTGEGVLSAGQFQEQLISHLASLPGVQSVCPQRDILTNVMIKLPDERGPEGTGRAGNQFENVPFHWVTARYLETIGTPLILGRGFTAEEVGSKSPVVIVSQSTARNLWPGENPLGKTLHIEQLLGDRSTRIIMSRARVIGVARDNQIYRSGHIPPLFLYAPQPSLINEIQQVLVRTVRDAASMKELIRKEASALESRMLLNVGTMESILGDVSNINATRIASELAITLASLALLLATLGLYGVMSYAVAQRTREIGIRMALGARGSHVQIMVVAQGMKLVLIGVMIGVPISMAVSKMMSSMLFGLSTKDPTTYGGVTLLLAISGLIACWMPARRAAKVEPMVALKAE